MNKRRWLSFWAVPVLLALALALPQSPPATQAAADAVFVEDFSTTTYKGPTSEVVWDTANGELYLVSRESEQSRPVAVLNGDMLFTAWWDTRGLNRRVYYQWIDDHGPLLPGSGYLTARDLPQEGGSFATQYGGPVAARINSTSVAVAWPALVDGLYTIFVQRIGTDGVKLWSAHKPVLPSGSSVPLHHPSIAAGSSGIVVTWSAGSTYHVYAQRFDLNGNRQWGSGVQVDTTVQVPDDSAYQDTRAQVGFAGMTSTGEAFVAMQIDAEPDPLSQYEYFAAAQKLNAAGDRIWPHDVIVLATHDAFIDFMAAGYKSDGMVAIYQNEYEPHIGSVIIHADGSAEPGHGFGWACDMLLCSNVTISPVSSGGLWYAWQGTRDGQYGVFGNWYDLATERPVFLTEPDGEEPFITGSAIQSFTAYVKTGDDGRNRVWVKGMDGSGYPTVFSTVRVVPYDTYFAETGTAESKKVSGSFGAVGSAKLTAEMALNGGTAAFELSNNGGATWHSVTPGTPFTFPTPGSDLRWRMTLSSPNGGQASPVLTRVTIEYGAPTVSNTRTPTATVTATATATATQHSEQDLPLKLFLPWVER